MSDEELRRIKAANHAKHVINRAKKALQGVTPGPWNVVAECDGIWAGRRTVIKADDPDRTTQSLNRLRVVTVDQTRPHHAQKAEANIAFIAEARSLVPELIAEVETWQRAWEGANASVTALSLAISTLQNRYNIPSDKISKAIADATERMRER